MSKKSHQEIKVTICTSQASKMRRARDRIRAFYKQQELIQKRRKNEGILAEFQRILDEEDSL